MSGRPRKTSAKKLLIEAGGPRKEKQAMLQPWARIITKRLIIRLIAQVSHTCRSLVICRHFVIKWVLCFEFFRENKNQSVRLNACLEFHVNFGSYFIPWCQRNNDLKTSEESVFAVISRWKNSPAGARPRISFPHLGYVWDENGNLKSKLCEWTDYTTISLYSFKWISNISLRRRLWIGIDTSDTVLRFTTVGTASSFCFKRYIGLRGIMCQKRVIIGRENSPSRPGGLDWHQMLSLRSLWRNWSNKSRPKMVRLQRGQNRDDALQSRLI